MNIIIHEIKKLLNWKMLLILFLVNVVLYFLLIDFDIQHYPNGRPALDSYRIGLEMVDTYGPEMDEIEIKDFKETYHSEIKKADEFLQGRADAQELGITSYEKLMSSDGNDASDLRSKIMHDERIDLFWELQERERIIQFHDRKDTVLQYQYADTTPMQKNHISDLLNKNHFDLYPEIPFQNYKSIINSIAIAVLISVVLVVSPVYIRDRSLRMLDLQYTSKIGRAIFKKKTVAAFISSFIVMTILLAIYIGIYLQNNPIPFLDVPINAFIGEPYWYDLTFFQYIVLTIVAIYVIGFILTLIALTISNVVPSYVTLIGVQVPIIFALLTLGLHYLLYHIIILYLPIWLVPTCYVALLITTIAIVITFWKKEKVRDVLL